jgi:hypothetical protein
MITRFTAGESLAFGDVVYIDATLGQFKKADADTGSTAPAIALCLETSLSSGAAGNFLMHGFVTKVSSGVGAYGGPNTIWYLSTTAGNITTTPPSAKDDVVQIIGVALSEYTLYFHPQLVFTILS